MRRRLYVLAVLVPLVAVIAVSAGFNFFTSASAASPVCTPTGFVREGINLTAVLINPKGTVKGKVNATGCNIAVYFGPGAKGNIDNADIYGANYFGVVNNGGKVNVANSRVHAIGEVPFNGTQHGVAIYFAYGSKATGSITNNRVWAYQKGGIVVNGVGTKANIIENIVTGNGPIDYIAQNGIQVGYGARATVNENYVSGNSYTGAGVASDGGIIVVGGECYGAGTAVSVGTQINENTVIGNDIGIWLSNLDASCGPTIIPTRVVVNDNTSKNDAINNTSGAGPGAGYQAGIVVQGNYDKIIDNRVCGKGYTPVPPPPYLLLIDDTATNHPIEDDNVSCSTGKPIGPQNVAQNLAQTQAAVKTQASFNLLVSAVI